MVEQTISGSQLQENRCDLRSKAPIQHSWQMRQSKRRLTGSSPRDLKIGDFNHDGKLDFLPGNGSPNSISVLLKNQQKITNPTNFKKWSIVLF